MTGFPAATEFLAQVHKEKAKTFLKTDLAEAGKMPLTLL